MNIEPDTWYKIDLIEQSWSTPLDVMRIADFYTMLPVLGPSSTLMYQYLVTHAEILPDFKFHPDMGRDLGLNVELTRRAVKRLDRFGCIHIGREHDIITVERYAPGHRAASRDHVAPFVAMVTS